MGQKLGLTMETCWNKVGVTLSCIGQDAIQERLLLMRYRKYVPRNFFEELGAARHFVESYVSYLMVG